MVVKNPSALPDSPRSLLDPWQTWRSTFGMAAAFWVLCVALWLLITGFDTARLVRTGPWELITLALGSVFLQSGLRVVRGYWQEEPRVVGLWGMALMVCAATLIVGAIVSSLLPEFKFVFGKRKIHGFNGFLIAAVLSAGWLTVFLFVNDMRLSALEPQRDARLRAASQAKRAQKDATATSRWQRARRALLALCTWQVPTHAYSQPLDVFTWQRVLVKSVLDYVSLTILLFLIVSALMFSGVFGEPTHAASLLEKFDDRYNQGWASTVIFSGTVSGGYVALALARRFVPWLNHTASATVLLVMLVHGLFALPIIFNLRSDRELQPFLIVGICVALICGVRTCQLFLNRMSVIDAEQFAEQERARGVADSQRALALADLKALQAQIEPHFLYNTLANLQLLIRQDAGRADAMAGHLIDYLRARLPAMRAPTTTLAQELDMVSSYLALLQIRMGQRLQYSIDLAQDCAQASVPPLVVMTLVENAIQHGLEPKRGGGNIRVSAQREGDWLCVEVADTGVGLGASPKPGSGVGLGNVRERLNLQHPDARDANGQPPRVDLLANEPSGTRALLRLPLGLPHLTAEIAP